jgi:hypothetical protein
LQVFYSVRSERMLMEQMQYNLLFRWFVGLTIEDTVWNHSVFKKNRDRLLEREVVESFFTGQGSRLHEALRRCRQAVSRLRRRQRTARGLRDRNQAIARHVNR